MTALFCDLVDSVKLSVRLDPEDMMQVMDAYLAACERVVSQHAGYVFQYMGDGVLAYFGYPRANEDDPANAVRAGLALRDAVAGLDLPMEIRLQTRVGIATGLVVVSDLSGQGKTRESPLVGETPNLAARLQSAAAPDTVVVAKTTQSLTAGVITYRSIGPFSLKGFETPVEAAEAVEARAVPSRFLARARGKITPLVGREQELRRILGGWAAARAGHGQVVLIQGEAGIGKSRLVEELRAHAADIPHAQVVWHCGPTHGDSALYPIAQQLARAAGFSASDNAAKRPDKLSGLLVRYGETEPLAEAVLGDLLGIPPDARSPLEAMPPEKRREVTLGAVLGMMDRQAGRGPALFILEDAHWSDATTLELLGRAVARAAGRSWLIVVTARPEFQPAWLGQAAVTHINLGRLDRGQAERICAHLGAGSLLPAEAVRQIVARCDGVPLFVEEMTKSVLEAVAAPVGDGVAPAAIPMSVQDSLAARLDRLGSARRVANLGAAIGRRFSYALLAAVAAQPEAELRQALCVLDLSGVVDTSGLPPSSFYVFKHALIRDTAYESLLKRERQTLHGRIAATLRDCFPHTRETEPELLAYHFTESGAIDDAAPLWAEAGSRAAARAAHVEAVGHLRKALDLARRAPPGPARAAAELPVLLGLGVSLSALHGYSYPEAAQVFGEAQAICNALGNPAALLPVLCGIASFRCVTGEMAAAEEVARQCVAIADQTGMAEHRMIADCHLGYILAYRGRLPEARQRLENAIAIYGERNLAPTNLGAPQDTLVHCRAVLLLALVGLGDLQTADSIAEEMIVHARSLGRPYDLVFGLAFRAGYWQLTGDYARSYRDADELARLCDEYSYSMYRALGLRIMGIALGILRGRSEGLPLILEGAAAADRMGVKHAVGGLCLGTALVHAAHGGFAAALASCDEAAARAAETGDEYYLSPIHLSRASFLEALNADGAEAEAHRALEIAEGQGAVGFAAEARLWLERHGSLTTAA